MLLAALLVCSEKCSRGVTFDVLREGVGTGGGDGTAGAARPAARGARAVGGKAVLGRRPGGLRARGVAGRGGAGRSEIR